MPEAAPVLESCQRYPHLQWRSMGGKETFPVACKSWKCPYCAPNLAKFYRWRIGEWARVLDLSRFITLTLDPSLAWTPSEWQTEVIEKARVAGLNPDDPRFIQWYTWKYIKKVWNIFLTNLRRRHPDLQFICVMEPQKNGNQHLHVFINQYIHISEIKMLWQRSGGGYKVEIDRVESIRRIAWYVANYITKISKINMELYPDRARRFTTSRGIMIQFYPKQVNVSKDSPELDREDLPWLNCFPDENFENCKNCIYKGKCRGHPPLYELLCNGKRMHELPRRFIVAPVKKIYYYGFGVKQEVVHCGQVNLEHAPCKGCLHIDECRLLFSQPYLPEHVVNHRTGELTKCKPLKEPKTIWKPPIRREN